jgi:hypothetical protein
MARKFINLLIILSLCGCASHYTYDQVDDDIEMKTVTKVRDTQTPMITVETIQLLLIAAGTLAAFSMALNADGAQ